VVSLEAFWSLDWHVFIRNTMRDLSEFTVQLDKSDYFTIMKEISVPFRLIQASLGYDVWKVLLLSSSSVTASVEGNSNLFQI
jgi:hypothetical protein